MARLCDVCGKKVPQHQDSSVYLMKPKGEVKSGDYEKELWELCTPCSIDVNWHVRNKAIELSENHPETSELLPEEEEELLK